MAAATAVEIGPGFWNFRGQFKIFGGLVDIGTHMSICRLSNGRFLVIDTIHPTDAVRAEIDRLTDGGKLIDGVVATHPFHTVTFRAFYHVYPNPPYYGTPRHLQYFPDIPWAGDVNNLEIRQKWEPDVEMRIPAGAEFVRPLPEKNNHFSNVFVFHRPSRTIHNDDNILVVDNFPFILKVFGFKNGSMYIHPSLKGPGLYPTAEAPKQYHCSMQKMIEDWDFDNICTAHNANKVGGAKELLRATLEKYAPVLEKISVKNQQRGGAPNPKENAGGWSSDPADGCECG